MSQQQQNNPGVKLISPGGRYVSGSHTERQTEGYEGEKYEEGKGPFTVGIAIQKNAQGIAEFLGGIYQAAYAGYATPQGATVQQRIMQEFQSGFSMGMFAFKIKDGDKPNQKGAVNPNTQGCWVFWLTSYLNPIKCSHWQIPDCAPIPSNSEIDPNKIKRGDYVDFSVSVKVNGNLDRTAGIYLNPLTMRLLGYGQAIIGGVSTEEAYEGAAAPVIPVGASSMPIGPGAGAGAPQMDQQQPGMGGVQVPGMGQQQQPGVQVPGMGQQPQMQPQQQYQQPQQQYQQPQQQYQQPQVPGVGQQQPGVQVPGMGQQPGNMAIPGAGQPIQQQQPQQSTTGYPSNQAQSYPQILTPQGQPQQQQPGMGGTMPQIPGM